MTSIMIPVWLLAVALGTIARHGVNMMVQHRFQSTFPYATLTVNLLGSLWIGMALGAFGGDRLAFVLSAAFLGAFTTFSTFQVEALQLLHAHKFRLFFSYFFGSYAGGLALAALGYRLFL